MKPIIKRAFCMIVVCLCLLMPSFASFAEDSSAENANSITTYSGSVTRTVYNSDGQSLSDYLGIYRSDVINVLRPHINDNYYLGTPYKGTDYRNPNGDPAGYGANDEPGVPAMNCTGFVWHVLTSAGAKNVPGYSGWVSMIHDNNITYITYVDTTGTNSQDLRKAVAADAEPGDIIWSWEGSASNLENGLNWVRAKRHHVGIYVGYYFNAELNTSNPTGLWGCTNTLAWWHSTEAIDGEAMENGTNLVTPISPKTLNSCSYTLVKLSGSLTGNLNLTKTSSNPKFSEGNPSYSLANAVYGVYSDPSCTQKVGELITDKNGKTNTITLKEGNYWFKELTPPKGFALDTQIYPATVKHAKAASLSVKDTPQYSFIDILLQKVDSETQNLLSGAEFTVKYYPGQYTEDPSALGQTPSRIWNLKTDADGICKLNDSYKISGDDFFVADGQSVLPLGTITIQEIKAPDGYLLDDQMVLQQISPSGTAETVEGFSAISAFGNLPAMGRISLTKTDGETGSFLPGAEFEILAYEDIITPDGTLRYEKDTVVDTITTDENGLAVSKGLYLGTYSVKETQPPEGYLLSEEEHLVTLEHIDQLTPVVEVELEITNQPIPPEPEEEPKTPVAETPEEPPITTVAKTSDAGSFGIYLLLFIASLGLIAVKFGAKRLQK